MVDEHTRELMHKEIDGEATAAESHRLNAILAQDAGAKAFFDEMKDLNKFLGSARQLEPPASLHARIMNSLPASGRGTQPRRSLLSFLSEFRLPEFRPAFALTLLAGLILGLVGTLIYTHNMGSAPEMLSEVVGSSVARTPVSALSPAQEIHLGVPGAGFDLDLRTSREAVLLKLSGSSSKALLVQIRYAADEITLDSFHNFGREGRGFLSDADGITLTVEGRTDVGFLFHPVLNTAHRLQVRVFDGSRLLGESTLSTMKPG